MWSTKLYFSLRGLHFLRRFAYNFINRVWAPKNIQGRGSLDAHCELYWGPYLLTIQAPVRSARVSYGQLPRLFEKLCSLYSSLGTISQDIVGCFDVSLLSMVPVGEAMSLLSQHFEENIPTLFFYALFSLLQLY
jgi:hypothetical protein